MTTNANATPEAGAGNDPPPSFMRDWVLPVGVGLVIGAGLVWAWSAAGLGSPARMARSVFMSDVEKIADRWEPFNADLDESLRGEVRALGKEARERVLRAFRAAEVKPADTDSLLRKLWIGQLLARDPFFDTASLLAICRDESAPVWDRRAAAVVICDVLGKDVDPHAVSGILVSWVEDRTLLDHGQAFLRLKTLVHFKVFPPEMRPRMIAALSEIASGRGGPAPADEIETRIADANRFTAILELGGPALTDMTVRELLWKIALDESDSVMARIGAIRAFGESGMFSDLDKWKQAASSKTHQVRQTVADNLLVTQDPAFDPVLRALHRDEYELARSGSVDAQSTRRRPTALPIMDELIEDHSLAVRLEAIHACGVFKVEDEGTTPSQRAGMLLRIVETSQDYDELGAAICALKAITGKVFGFAEGDVEPRIRQVRPEALVAFQADPKGRADAVRQWRETLPNAVWTDGDRRKTWEKLRSHADKDNVARAEALLAGREPPKPAGHDHAHGDARDE